MVKSKGIEILLVKELDKGKHWICGPKLQTRMLNLLHQCWV